MKLKILEATVREKDSLQIEVTAYGLTEDQAKIIIKNLNYHAVEHAKDFAVFDKRTFMTIDVEEEECGWISVKDKKPKNYESVLVWNTELNTGCYSNEDGWQSNAHGKFYGKPYGLGNVTHWMLLPKGPEKK